MLARSSLFGEHTQSRVYGTVECPSVGPFVRPCVFSIDRQQQRRAACLLLSALLAGYINR